MAINKLALLRYKTIDQCLSNRYRKWTMPDLIAKVSEVLYDIEGVSSGVSRRTIQADIQLMRSDKLGYNAPIVIVEKKYYTYSDKNYTITKSPVSETDLKKMQEMLTILKQMNGFQYFDAYADVVLKLENSILKTTTNQKQDIIQFESNPLLKGLSLLHPLYQYIEQKQPITIIYKSFKARREQQIIAYPYLLKEYRNRWFLICKEKKKKGLTTLALDRMITVNELPEEKYIAYSGVSFDRYFEDTIGVSKNETDRGIKVIFWVAKANAPYIITKPIHASQKLLAEKDEGSIFSIVVVLNFELEKEILSNGAFIKVMSPRILQKKIQRTLESAAALYLQENKV